MARLPPSERIELPPETRERLVASIRRFLEEELEQEVGELKASIVLDYALAEIGPSVYNQAVRDARRHMAARLEEMDGAVHRREFSYWTR